MSKSVLFTPYSFLYPLSVLFEVYQRCKDLGMGFLSVAHRPTVIQYHTRVLHFFFEDSGTLSWEFQDAAVLSAEVAPTPATHALPAQWKAGDTVHQAGRPPETQ